MIELNHIRQQKLSNLNVLLIGDSCQDTYYYGSCDRLSPETGAPVFRMINQVSYDGMSLNVFNNLVSLGIRCDFLTHKEVLYKERYVDIKTGKHLLRVDLGEANPVHPFIIDEYLELKKDYDVIIISDYDKGYITHAAMEKLFENYSGLIFVDSKKSDLSCFNNAIIKINLDESRALTRLGNNCKVITTAGYRGALYDDVLYPVAHALVQNVSGAGDSFFAGMIVSYLITRDIPTAIRFGNICGRLAVEHDGTYIIDIKDLEEI